MIESDDSSDTDENSDSHTYDKGNVNLYKTVNANGDILHFNVGDGSGKMSPKFRVRPHRIVLTEEAITIKYISQSIILYPEGKTFPLYQKLIPHENYTVSIDIHQQICTSF